MLESDLEFEPVPKYTSGGKVIMFFCELCTLLSRLKYRPMIIKLTLQKMEGKMNTHIHNNLPQKCIFKHDKVDLSLNS